MNYLASTEGQVVFYTFVPRQLLFFYLVLHSNLA